MHLFFIVCPLTFDHEVFLIVFLQFVFAPTLQMDRRPEYVFTAGMRTKRKNCQKYAFPRAHQAVVTCPNDQDPSFFCLAVVSNYRCLFECNVVVK